MGRPDCDGWLRAPAQVSGHTPWEEHHERDAWEPEHHPQREEYWGHVNPIGVRSVYDEGMRFAEATTMAYARERGVDVGVARIFNTYGPRMSLDDGRVVPAFLGQALSGAPLTVAGDGSQTRSLCWIEDTVEGLLRLACADAAGPVNIGSDHEVTVLELARTVIELTGSESRIHHVALPADDPHVRRPDLTRARLLLGWEPEMPLEEGLKRTALWREETRSTAPLWNLSGRAASPRVLAGTDRE